MRGVGGDEGMGVICIGQVIVEVVQGNGCISKEKGHCLCTLWSSVDRNRVGSGGCGKR